MYIAEGDEAATTVTTGGTFYKMAGTTTEQAAIGFTHTNGRLTYNGPDRTFFVLAVVTVSVNLAGGIVHLQLAKNGTPVAASEQHRKVGSAGDLGNMSCSMIVDLAAGDYIELWTTTDVGQDGKLITAEHMDVTVL
jgi:hypothetical protein